MIRLGKVGGSGGRGAAWGLNISGKVSGCGGRYSYCRHFEKNSTGIRLQAQRNEALQLFTLAKPPRTWARKLPSLKGVPFSAVTMGQKAQKSAVQSGKVKVVMSIREVTAMLQEAMVKNRLVFGTKTNVSNVCGHASFVILALAYLETDVLALRGYAASGIGLSILFQFYRAQPLWIPIGWNGLFLAINVTMIGLLLKDKNFADTLDDDPEQAKIYEEVFMPFELTPFDFMHLMDFSERLEVPKGGRLSAAGKVQEDVFIIVEGTAEVESEGSAVCHLQPKQFVGSMAFNRFIQASAIASTPPSVLRRTSAADPAPSDTVDEKGGRRHSSIEPVSNAMDDDRETENGESDNDGDGDDDVDEFDYMHDSYVAGGGGVLEDAKGVALDLLRKDSIVGEAAKSLVTDIEQPLQSGVAMERSATTVTATTDVVVYAWKMHSLRAFIKRRPLAGASLRNAISADLTRKVDQSRGHGERYRLLLAEALDGGVITPIEKKKLHRYRDMHGISLDEHRELVREHEWKEEEFEAGFQKGVIPRDGSKDFLTYEALVRRELAKGQVEEKGRQRLWQFRTKAGIDAQEHLLALEKQGWTADDYEVGGKGRAEGFNQTASSQPTPAKNSDGQKKEANRNSNNDNGADAAAATAQKIFVENAKNSMIDSKSADAAAAATEASVKEEGDMTSKSRQMTSPAPNNSMQQKQQQQQQQQKLPTSRLEHRRKSTSSNLA